MDSNIQKGKAFSKVPEGKAKTIAVLPFVNMSSDKENEYFSDGMTEEIINALAKIKALSVTSRTSSFHFKNKNIPVPQIGRQLNVSTILEGSIRLAGNMMRITAQLIDVEEDFHFWSETFDRPLDDVFAVQDEISLLIADKLREHIGHLDIEEHLVEAQNVPVDLYKQYLKARHLILLMKAAEIEEALTILKDIIGRQPDYALAHLGVHHGYTLIGTLGLIPFHEAFSKGQPYLEKAIALDPSLPECQINLAWNSLLLKWDFEATYQHLQRSVEVRPTTDYYQTMASTLVAEGRQTAAMHYIDTAFQVDPFSAINYHLKGFVYYTLEDYDKAIHFFREGIELNSRASVSILYLGQALILKGQKEEALQYFQALPPDEPGDLLKQGGLTLAHAALGHAEVAQEGIQQMESLLETHLVERATQQLILCHTVLGNNAKALQLLEQGISQRLPLMIYFYAEPLLKPLREEARFQHQVQRILGKKRHAVVATRKYKKALFTKEELAQHRHALEQFMKEQQPFLDQNLSLRSLAEMMNLPSNHLSQLLNEGFDKNFSEFVNTYRLEAFKARAADPKNHHLTILALAYESGFNSKTVFNTFFKKTMGITPSQYWKKTLNS
jgi:adenylate cyclase